MKLSSVFHYIAASLELDKHVDINCLHSMANKYENSGLEIELVYKDVYIELKNRHDYLAQQLAHYQAESCRRASEQREQNETIRRLAYAVVRQNECINGLMRSTGYCEQSETLQEARHIVDTQC